MVVRGALKVRRAISRRLMGYRRFFQPMTRATDMLDRFASLPFGEIEAVATGKRILILAPHADDESLGCGGLIAHALSAGSEVFVIILTDGAKSHPNSKSYPASRLIALREDEAAAAVAVLGIKPDHLVFFRYPDGSAPLRGRSLRQAVIRLADFVDRNEISMIASTWPHDPHTDHVSAHRIAAGAARMSKVQHLSYLVWGWTLAVSTWLPVQPIRGVRLDVTQYLDVKRRAVACHKSQYSNIIEDDPSGFTIPAHLFEISERSYEVYLFNDA